MKLRYNNLAKLFFRKLGGLPCSISKETKPYRVFQSFKTKTKFSKTEPQNPQQAKGNSHFPIAITRGWHEFSQTPHESHHILLDVPSDKIQAPACNVLWRRQRFFRQWSS
jgi:hypothetical protein